MSKSGHTAAYPVEIPERNVRLYSDEGDSILDPFVGSGTTIIACERQGRRAFAMEIEPRYVDVSVRRWEAYTGGKAERA
jgi:DNA modification methylase